jgi:hypothetical protein
MCTTFPRYLIFFKYNKIKKYDKLSTIFHYKNLNIRYHSTLISNVAYINFLQKNYPNHIQSNIIQRNDP